MDGIQSAKSCAIVANRAAVLPICSPEDVNLRSIARALFVQGTMTVLLLVGTLRLWRTDLRVPINYWGDTLLQLAVAKNIADGGWIWFIGHLGAPFGLAMAAFPQNLTTTSVVLKILSMFSAEPGVIINVYWLFTIVLASLNAHLALRMLGYRTSTALLLATLYALLPYAFYRNVAHLPLVFPFIPVLAAFAVQIAANASEALTGRWGRYVAFCAIAQGFDYVYYTFFSVFVFVVAGLLALFYHRSRPQALRAVVLCAVLTVSAMVNLAPSFVEWSKHGKPPHTSYKSPAEAEIFGLKLRQLLSPVQPSRFEVLRKFGQREYQFPNENENISTRLGTLLSIGLLGMLAHAFFGRRLAPQLRAAAALTLACFLLATVGGFGALFNLLVAPDIRAYNRMVVFIAFFVIVYMAYFTEAWTVRQDSRGSASPVKRIRPLAALALVIALVFGVMDQGQVAQSLVGRYSTDAASFWAERALVAQVERRNPEGGAIMQLPESKFPPDEGRVRMLTYDQARPYLSSGKLSWSWPSFSQRRDAWYKALGTPDDPAFLGRLAASGFVGVWVDRYGYSSAELAALEGAFTTRLGPPMVGGVGERYAYFDLSPIRSAPGLSPADKYRLLNPVLLTYGRGLYDEEQEGERRHRWSQRTSSIRLRNDGEIPRTATFHAILQAGEAGTIRVAMGGRQLEPIPFSASESRPFSAVATIPAKSSVDLTFTFDGPRFAVPGDARTLYFALINPGIEER